MEITLISKIQRWVEAKLLLGLLYNRGDSNTERPRTKAASFWVMAQSQRESRDYKDPGVFWQHQSPAIKTSWVPSLPITPRADP